MIWLVATTGSCAKQKNMSRVLGIYSGVLCLSFMFLVAATLICISLLGYCTEEWLPRNLTIGCVSELILFIWGIFYIKRGAYEILRITHNIALKKELYERISFLMGFGMVFALIIVCFPYRILSDDGNSYVVLIYAGNIFVPALIYFVWMCIGIRKMNKQIK